MIIGGSTVLLNDGGRRVLVPGLNDVIVIVQIKDILQLIVNGRDKHSLTAAESLTFSVRGNVAKVYTDRSVSFAIQGLQPGAAASPSSSAKERLSHARQRSGALSGVVARQRVADELMKDPFLIGVANLILRLCQYFGVPLKAPRAPKAPSDLAPLIAEAAKTLEFQIVCKPLPEQPAAVSPVQELAERRLQDLLQSIVQSLQQLPARARESGQPDLNPLASQLLEALRRLVFETSKRPALSVGQWPAESKAQLPESTPKP